MVDPLSFSNFFFSLLIFHIPDFFLQFDITEHWCFCASDECNRKSCYHTHPFLEMPSKRRPYFFDNYWAKDQASDKSYLLVNLLGLLVHCYLL